MERKLTAFIEVENGTKADGTPRLQRRTFTQVNQKATDQQLVQGLKAIASLMSKPAAGYAKVEVTPLS